MIHVRQDRTTVKIHILKGPIKITTLKHKYEIYLPESYVKNGELVPLDINTHINNIIKRITNDNISGISIRKETGYYSHSNGNVNKTTNQILYFYTEKLYNYEWIIDYIKNNMYQETVLIAVNNEGRLY